MRRPKKILFTEQERRRMERKNKLVGGLKSFGRKMYSGAKKGIEREVKLKQEEKEVYNRAFRKEKLRQIKIKARRRANPKRKKVSWI